MATKNHKIPSISNDDRDNFDLCSALQRLQISKLDKNNISGQSQFKDKVKGLNGKGLVSNSASNGTGRKQNGEASTSLQARVKYTGVTTGTNPPKQVNGKNRGANKKGHFLQNGPHSNGIVHGTTNKKKSNISQNSQETLSSILNDRLGFNHVNHKKPPEKDSQCSSIVCKGRDKPGMKTLPYKNDMQKRGKGNSSENLSALETVQGRLQDMILGENEVNQSRTEASNTGNGKRRNKRLDSRISGQVNGNSKNSTENGLCQPLKVRHSKDDITLPDGGGGDVAEPVAAFRLKNLYLRKGDIHEKVFLRANITKGSFSSVDHYLEIQFDLLREDFIATIREDLVQFSNSKPHSTPQIKVYNEATFVKYEVKKNKCGVLVRFEEKKGKKKSEFMQGALLGFTNDGFKSYFFGSVLESGGRGEVVVKMYDNFSVGELFECVFTMIEPLVFYEPYFHVMKALQSIDESDLPMKQYIINGDNVQRPPAYLNGKTLFKIKDNENVPVLDLESDKWPDSKKLNLDDSQYQAFRTALTQEFVVIQGPPGTGKTYLGLEVTKVLLENKNIWYEGGNPIMVVCFTNHALDQFLEGLLSVTKELVRIGGQSRSEALKRYNLRNAGKFGGWFFSEKKQISSELRDCAASLENINSDLKSIQHQAGIISLQYFVRMGIISERDMKGFSSKFHSEAPKDNYLSWLLCNDEHENESISNFLLGRGSETPFINLYEGETEYYYPVEYDLLQFNLELIIDEIRQEMHNWATSNKDEHLVRSNIWVLEEQYMEVVDMFERLKSCVSSKVQADKALLAKFSRGCNIWTLSCYERWAIYKYWEAELKSKLLKFQSKLYGKALVIEQEYVREQARCDAAKLEETLIFGMTTTGAARNRHLLHKLRPKIVIVEEAAEVMESHIIASLTRYCEHLILIGDHQQLRPNVNVHRLRLHFGFDISLFERMVNNGLNCETLAVQHRMRPEIACLITPTIYPNLKNHSSVYDFPPVKGIMANVYFLSHEVCEDEMKESLSHKNSHEVEFLILLGRHLVLQGYQPTEITIITTYKAQMLALKSEKDRHQLLHDVRVTTVDDFQGEENRIILLSLVRSNRGRNIGFLRTENRICVALSRAKEGFYIIGNMMNLADKSDVWHQIHNTLRKQDAIGPSLLVRCQRHPEQMTIIASPQDFLDKVPEGGCSLFCDMELECGHKCPHKCHVVDLEHKDRYKCRFICNKEMCPEGHKCKKECWEKCGVKCVEPVLRLLPCEHESNLPCYVDWKTHECERRVLRTLTCEHEIMLPCHMKWEEYKCEVMVEKKVSCGHILTLKCCTDVKHVTCSEKCMKPLPCGHSCNKQCHASKCPGCTVLSQKTYPSCGHTDWVLCCEDITKKVCPSPCEKILPCGHQCSAKCGQPCPACSFMMTSDPLPCGHKISVKCGAEAFPSDCREKCGRKLECGHLCTALCNEPCVTVCSVLRTFKMPGVCGHEIELPCSKHGSLDADSEELLSYCNAPCGKLLPCGHKCNGKCNKCLQGRVHSPCTEHCSKILICGHRCEAPCYLSCPPCQLRYTYDCGHRKQNKKCFKKLDPCHEPCSWECEHRKCSKACSDVCTRKPCEVACKKLLPCGHSCLGFCGEPCPQLCAVCNKDEMPANVEENKDDLALRFVFLVDCKHIIESSVMNERIAKCDVQILMLTCPKCGIAVINTLRYRNYAKTYVQYEMAVKSLIVKNKKKIESKQTSNVSFLESLINKESTRGELKKALLKICKKTHQDFFDAETFQIETSIASKMMKCFQECVNVGHSSIKCRAIAYLESLVEALAGRGDYISADEVNAWQREIMRLERVVQVCKVVSLQNFEDNSKFALLDTVTKMLFSIEPYSIKKDSEVKLVLNEIMPESYWKVDSSLSDSTTFLKIMGMNEGYWLKSHVRVPWILVGVQR